MSLGRTIFGRMVSALQRGARGTEEWGRGVNTNIKLVRRFIFYGGVCYCTGALFGHWVLDWGVSEGNSMYPTMTENTPFFLRSKLHGHGKNMSPGDLVLFLSPIFHDVSNGKRIIGMPGDYVVLDPHQSPSVGGALVPGVTDWRSQREKADGVELKDREEPMMIEVPEGHMYAVGDNLSWSRDSRFFGPVPLALVEGKQILHRNSGMGKGWYWTTGDQLRRIPKEEEDEYLRSSQQRQIQNQQAAAQKTSSPSAETVD